MWLSGYSVALKVPAYNSRNLQCKLNLDATEGSACPPQCYLGWVYDALCYGNDD